MSAVFARLREKLKGVMSRFTAVVKREETARDDERKPLVREEALPRKEAKPEEKVEEQKPEQKARPEKESAAPSEVGQEAVKPASERVKHKEAVSQKVEPAEQPAEEQPRKGIAAFTGFIKDRVTTTTISDKHFEELFSELELALLENNVALEVVDHIHADLREQIVEKPIKRSEVADSVSKALRASILDLFSEVQAEKDFVRLIRDSGKKPFVIAFFGVNGAGKTTTIAKIAHLLKKTGLSCVMAASDTFRAAAIQQLEEHANRLNVKIIKHDYGADAAAVAFDAVRYAEAKNLDAVLIDTAGRQHSNINLMDELKKLIRVAKPDLRLFVGESITGNDCIEQARQFNDAIGIDAIVLAKVDVDEKGGAALSVSFVTKKPIMFLGTGQRYDDLASFNPEVVVDGLGL